MSLTTQSESEPLVEAMRLAMGWPLILTGEARTSVAKTRTSGRPEDSRWSSTSHCAQVRSGVWPMGWLGRARYGTGLSGSEMYSSKGASEEAGADMLSFDPAVR